MFAGAHSRTNTSWYQTGSPSLSSGKFGGRGRLLQLQRISKSPFVSVSLRVFHSDASENQQHQTLRRSLRLPGKKRKANAVTFSSASHGLSGFPTAGVKLAGDASYLRRSDKFLSSSHLKLSGFHLQYRSHAKRGWMGDLLSSKSQCFPSAELCASMRSLMLFPTFAAVPLIKCTICLYPAWLSAWRQVARPVNAGCIA